MKNPTITGQSASIIDIESNKQGESKTHSFINKDKDRENQDTIIGPVEAKAGSGVGVVEVIKAAFGKIAQSRTQAQVKISNTNLDNLANAKSQFHIFHFTLYIILLFLLTVLTYVIKPVCTILQIALISQIASIKKQETDLNSAGKITNAVKVIGYCIIFVVPLINFFLKGIIIISIQYSVIGKIYTTFILLIEFIFQIPLTFMLENNLHSIFLFDQRGIEQLLSPWLVFFPSDYLLSIFELVRQYLDAIFFLVIGFRTYSSIKDNRYQAFSVSIVMLLLVLCIFRIIGNTVMLVIRLVWGNSEEKGLKKAKRKTK